MTATIDKAALLMREGCPIDLTDPVAVYDRLKSYLNGLGQEDGYWSPAGEAGIPLAFPESKLSTALQEYLKPGYVARASKAVAKRYEKFSWELHYMAQQMGFEFANGWRIFPIVTDEENNETQWFVTGLLFPAYDGKTEGWVIWAHAGEIFA